MSDEIETAISEAIEARVDERVEAATEVAVIHADIAEARAAEAEERAEDAIQQSEISVLRHEVELWRTMHHAQQSSLQTLLETQSRMLTESNRLVADLLTHIREVTTEEAEEISSIPHHSLEAPQEPPAENNGEKEDGRKEAPMSAKRKKVRLI